MSQIHVHGDSLSIQIMWAPYYYYYYYYYYYHYHYYYYYFCCMLPLSLYKRFTNNSTNITTIAYSNDCFEKVLQLVILQ